MSSIPQDISITQETKSLRVSVQSRRDNNPVWQYTRVGNEEAREDSKLKYCLSCEEDSVFSTNVSTNMRKYLAKMHKINVPIV